MVRLLGEEDGVPWMAGHNRAIVRVRIFAVLIQGQDQGSIRGHWAPSARPACQQTHLSSPSNPACLTDARPLHILSGAR